jgi:predicted nuclease of predicted toxin-antitoxin system
MSKQAIRFLADESCDFAVVRALRAAGHDVKAIAEVCPGISDHEVMRIGIQEGRVLLTEDKDFGWLVFAGTGGSASVIFIRFPMRRRSVLPAAIVEFVEQAGNKLIGSYAVVEPGRMRLTRIPER